MVIDGFLKGGSLEETTDGDGYAFFETADDYNGWCELIIYVRGKKFGSCYIRDKMYKINLE